MRGLQLQLGVPLPVTRSEQRSWFVLHTYSGYENKVKANLEKRVESMGMQDKIFQVLVPMEEEYEFKEGKKRITQKKIFPGYVLVDMLIDDDSWYVVRNTPGVTGFVGPSSRPIPLAEEEVENIMKKMGLGAARPKVSFDIGQSVRIVSGPFENFVGNIEEVSLDRGKAKVAVSMFGRETPLELEFSQLEEV